MVSRERDPSIQRLQNDVLSRMQNIVEPNNPNKVPAKQQNPDLQNLSIEAQNNIMKALEELKKLNAI